MHRTKEKEQKVSTLDALWGESNTFTGSPQLILTAPLGDVSWCPFTDRDTEQWTTQLAKEQLDECDRLTQLCYDAHTCSKIFLLENAQRAATGVLEANSITQYVLNVTGSRNVDKKKSKGYCSAEQLDNILWFYFDIWLVFAKC